MRKAVTFDDFSYVCPYFTSDTEVNNGYGCQHPMQEEKENNKGKCFCWSCPLGIVAEQEDLDHPDIDWDGLCKDDEVYEDEYLLVICDNSCSEDEKAALQKYEKYINRYN